MSTPLDVNVPAFWKEIYQGGRAGWELGGPTPIFRYLLASGEFAAGWVIALGAGRGHDAREFARHGFTVTAADFAADAVCEMRALVDPQAPIEILQADIFALPPTLDQMFEYVLEYACFCAFDPPRRAEYADLVARLLRPGGLYLATVFPLDDHVGGPPFPVSLSEIFASFGARGFTLLRRDTPADSVP